MVTYKVGDTIEYTTYGGDVRRVTVTAKHRNVKNGRAGFDAALSNSDGGGVSMWGYDTDVLRVILPTGEAHASNGKQLTAWELWEQYIGPCNSYLMPHGEPSGDYLQRLRMLQESIRKCMRAEHESYLQGHATAGRVAETKGHAVLLGKIIAAYERTHATVPYQGEPGLEESKGDSIGQ